MKNNYNAISLFSGAAIGDIGFQTAGFSFLVMSEMEPDRAVLAEANFPNTKHFVGDINEYSHEIIKYTKDICYSNKSDLFLVSCNAPCFCILFK